MNCINIILLPILCFTSFFFAWKIDTLANKPIIKVNKQESTLNIDSKVIHFLATGQRRLIADLLWIKTLLESDLSHYKSDDLNSWMFLRFKTISNLDPLFLRNYQFGGQYLNIIKDDLKGSEYIFEQGINHYPDDYELNFNAGFLQAYELKNFSKALTYYQKIVSNPKSPTYIKSLIIKLRYSETGDLNMALKLVQDMIINTYDPIIQKKLKEDLYSIQATIDIKCLNQKGSNCNNKDIEGSLYIKKGDKYIAPRFFNKYRLNI